MIADASWTYLILIRWLHVSCACVVVGGTLLFAMLELQPPDLCARRGFKLSVHVCTLLLLATGSFNAVLYWKAYRNNMPLTHGLFGPHVFFALLSLTILIIVLARKTPAGGERKWLRLTAVLLFLTVLMASSLKYAREHPKTDLNTPLHTQSDKG